MEKIKILKLGDLPKGIEVAPSTLKMDYIQEADSCDIWEDQILTLEVQNWGVESSDKFYVISTERWAFDSIEQITTVLQDFINRTK